MKFCAARESATAARPPIVTTDPIGTPIWPRTESTATKTITNVLKPESALAIVGVPERREPPGAGDPNDDHVEDPIHQAGDDDRGDDGERAVGKPLTERGRLGEE